MTEALAMNGQSDEVLGRFHNEVELEETRHDEVHRVP